MSVLFTFPGQGAQRPGMLHRLPDHPEAARTLAETGEVLGADPLALDTPEALASSTAVQLCLLVAGVAMARTLAALGAQPAMVAGLSIGAYPAAVTAGVLDYRDAVALVARRGGAASPVYLANLNAERQFVISGADAALDDVMALARAQGASRAERLAVSVPSHCPLFDGAAGAMRQAFAQLTLRRPRIVFLSSSAARMLADPLRIGEDLATNMARQVRWGETARLAWERGARLAVEMPPGLVLTNLSAPEFREGRAIGCDNTDIDSVLALCARFAQA